MSRILLSSVTTGIAVLMLSSCATTEKSMQERGLTPLTHNQLKTLMSRTRTTHWTTAENVTGTGTYLDDGSAEITWGGRAAQGAWRITGDKFCTRYPTIRKGNDVCYTLFKTGEKEYQLFHQDGSLNATVVFTN